MTWAHEHTFQIAATRDRIFDALTYPVLLTRWFAEHVDIDPRPAGEYRFWGRHTLEPRNAEDATQRITSIEQDDRLAFTWVLGGVGTLVDLTLRAIDRSTTTLTVRHTIDGDLPWPRQKELIDDMWRLSIGNLMALLQKGDGLLLPDYADPAPVVRQSVLIDATRDAVFRTLVEPALVNKWFGTDKARVDPRVGGHYRVDWQYTVGGRDVTGGPTRIIDMVADRLLVLDWPDWRGDPDVAPQHISFELEDDGSGTKLTFMHAGFGRVADISDYSFGWAYMLGDLRKAATAP